MSTTGFHVLLEDPEVLATRTGAVARVVAKELHEPVADAALKVRYGGGIVARDLGEPLALGLVARLHEAGFEAFPVPGDASLALPRTRRLAGVSIDESGLSGSIRGSERLEKLPWSRIGAIHVNVLARELSDEEAAEGRTPRPLHDMANLPEEACRLSAELDYWEDRERMRRLELCLDLVAVEPLQVFRITSEEADYRTLPGKTDSALANFLTLVRVLLQAAPARVVVPPSTVGFSQAVDWKAVLFDKPEQRDSWNLWLVLAIRYGKPWGRSLAAEPEDVDDASLQDDDEAEEVDAADAIDAEDLTDDEVEDEAGDEEEDDEEDADEDEDADDGEEEDEEADDDEPAVPAASPAPLASPVTDAAPAPAAPATTEAAPPATVAADKDVAAVLEHFDRTRKIRKEDVAEMVAAAADMDEKAIETDEVNPGPNVDAELQFFDEGQKTGRWDVKQLLDEGQELSDKDIADDA